MIKSTNQKINFKRGLGVFSFSVIAFFVITFIAQSCKKEVTQSKVSKELNVEQLKQFISQVQSKQSNKVIARYAEADLELDVSRDYVASALDFMLVQRNVVPLETEMRKIEVEMPYYTDTDTPFVSMYQLSDSVASFKDALIEDASQTSLPREQDMEILFTWVSVDMGVGSNKLHYTITYQLGKVPVDGMPSVSGDDYDVPCGTCLDFGMPVEKPGVSCNNPNVRSMDFSYYLNLNLNKCYRRRMPCGNYDPTVKGIYTNFNTKFYYYSVNIGTSNSPSNGAGNSLLFAKAAFSGTNSSLSNSQNALIIGAAVPPFGNSNPLYQNRTLFSTTSMSMGSLFSWQLDCIRGVMDDNVQYSNQISTFNETYIQHWAAKHKQFFEQTCNTLNVGLYSNLYVPYMIKVYPGVVEGNNEPATSGISYSNARWILWYPVMACYARATCSQLPAPPKVSVL